MEPHVTAPGNRPPPPQPRALLDEAGLRAKKSWGQNFLQDAHVLADIAALAEAAPGHTIVELGAGLGALTYHLLARGAAVTAIERDREIAPLLRHALSWAGAQLDVVEADAVQLDYAALATKLGGPLTVAGNLPYQLSSRILVSLAQASPSVRLAVLLVQREVAERLVAKEGSRIYGLLSVLVQRRLDVRLARTVPPTAFFPRPKVHSTVVVLTARSALRPDDEDAALVQVARAAFQHRRKMLRGALARVWHLEAAQLAPAFTQAGINETARAEELSIDDFARLGASLRAHGLLPRKGNHGSPT